MGILSAAPEAMAWRAGGPSGTILESSRKYSHSLQQQMKSGDFNDTPTRNVSFFVNRWQGEPLRLAVLGKACMSLVHRGNCSSDKILSKQIKLSSC
jgi:hypothetical protein